MMREETEDVRLEEGDITYDAGEDIDELLADAIGELGPGRRMVEGRPRTVEKGKEMRNLETERTAARPKDRMETGMVARKRRRVEEVEVVELKKNSEEFRKDMRPEMFKNDDVFNRLEFRYAANVCWEFVRDKKKQFKDKKRNTLEKCDDVLPLVKFEAAENNAKDKLSTEIRKKLKLVSKEIREQIVWFTIKWEEVIGNLPLE